MRATKFTPTLFLLAAFASAVAVASITTLQQPPQMVGVTESVILGRGVPPRFMWGWGPGLRGYCGETSFQSIGLFLGNYISSEHLRNAADGTELLLAVNDAKAAAAMKYRYEQWSYAKQKTPQGSNFIDWAASHIDAGHGVITGMFEEVMSGGDEDYDHIMPIVGYKRSTTAAAAAAANATTTLGRSDVTGILYNDLYRDQTLFGEKASTFIKTRAKCKPASGVTASGPPYNWCMPQEYDYGIALLGNADDDGVLLPTQLSISAWKEPDWGKEDQLHEPITTFTASVFVTKLTPGTRYSVLRFDTANAVPSSDFAKGSYTKRFDFTAAGSTYEMTDFDTFRSDSTIFYRTVVYA